METRIDRDARRLRRSTEAVLVTGLALLLCRAAAGEPPHQRRCETDALAQWYCAADEQGVAVRDNLGVVVCAPGSCIEVGDEWLCSAVSGGRAVLTPEGPVCEGSCRAPRAVDCERGRDEA